MSKRRKRIVYWEGKGPSGRSIWIEQIENFDARGKHLVFGRGDHFAALTLNMDIWQDRNGRLVARFWSRNSNVD